MLVSQFGLHQRPWARLLDCWLWREYFVYVGRYGSILARAHTNRSPRGSGQTRDTSVPRWVLKRQRSARASIGGTDPTGFKGTVHGPTGIPTSHPQAITVFTCIDTHQDSSLRRGPFCCGTRLAGGLILQGTD